MLWRDTIEYDDHGNSSEHSHKLQQLHVYTITIIDLALFPGDLVHQVRMLAGGRGSQSPHQEPKKNISKNQGWGSDSGSDLKSK